MATNKKAPTTTMSASALPHKTANNLDEKTRATSVRLLNECVLSGIDMALAAKQAHWNVRGLNFIAFHELLDELRATLDDGNDTMAERAVQLGGQALGTTQLVNERTTLPAYPLDIYKMEDHLDALIERLSMVTNSVREAEIACDDAGDLSTSDVFIEVNRALEKQLWFLEAHKVQ